MVRQEDKGVTEDEMVGQHHQLKRHEFEQTPRDGEGQGSLVCCSPWGCKESDMTATKRKQQLIPDSEVGDPCCIYMMTCNLFILDKI